MLTREALPWCGRATGRYLDKAGPEMRWALKNLHHSYIGTYKRGIVLSAEQLENEPRAYIWAQIPSNSFLSFFLSLSLFLFLFFFFLLSSFLSFNNSFLKFQDQNNFFSARHSSTIETSKWYIVLYPKFHRNYSGTMINEPHLHEL